MRPWSRRRVQVLIAWIIIAFVCVSLLLFLGAGYAALVALLVSATMAFFASSPTRWDSMQRWVRDDPQSESSWTPRVAIAIIVNGVQWLIVTIILFAVGNPGVFR